MGATGTRVGVVVVVVAAVVVVVVVVLLVVVASEDAASLDQHVRCDATEETYPMPEVTLSHPPLTPEVRASAPLPIPEVAVSQAPSAPEVTVPQTPAAPEVTLSAPWATPEVTVFQAPSAPLPTLEPTDSTPFWSLLLLLSGVSAAKREGRGDAQDRPRALGGRRILTLASDDDLAGSDKGDEDEGGGELHCGGWGSE